MCSKVCMDMMKSKMSLFLILLIPFTAINANRRQNLIWTSSRVENFTPENRYLFADEVYSELLEVASAYKVTYRTPPPTGGFTTVPPGKNQMVLFSLAVRNRLNLKLALTETPRSIASANHYTLQFSAKDPGRSTAIRCPAEGVCQHLDVTKGKNPVTSNYPTLNNSPEFEVHFYLFIDYKTRRIMVGRGALPSIEMWKQLTRYRDPNMRSHSADLLEELIFEFFEREESLFPVIVDMGFSSSLDHARTTFSSVTIIPNARTLFMETVNFLVPTGSLKAGLVQKEFKLPGFTWYEPGSFRIFDDIFDRHMMEGPDKEQIVPMVDMPVMNRRDYWVLYVFSLHIIRFS